MYSDLYRERCTHVSQKNKAHGVTRVTLRVHFYKHGGHIYLKREKGNKFLLPTTHLAGHFPPKAKPTYKTHNVLVKCRHPTFKGNTSTKESQTPGG